ncbi:MAG: STAS domain-containing protein [Clostridia bacterium]|nr:STAS domain-containing protein [Clostridia bacterium]
MNITTERDGNSLVISVSGRVDTVTAPELEKSITDNIDGVGELVLDLQNMTYTSSAGLRVILKAKKLMDRQGSLTVKNVRSEIMEIFDITGFSDILNIA